MKKIYILFAFAMIQSFAFAQTSIENYVKQTTIKTQVTNPSQISSLIDDHKQVSMTYFDGIGRPIQTISKEAGGNKENIIVPIVYDSLGRQSREYLPYADVNQTSSALNYINNDNVLIPNLEVYYNNKFPNEWNTNDIINPYSEKHFEFSAVNRVLEQGAPGKDWRLDKESDFDHSIKFKYQTNIAQEVDLFKVVFPTLDSEEPQLFHQGYYPENTLFKTITKDENWQPNQIKQEARTVEEFKNSQNQIILKRTYDSDGVKHDTQYVYDDFGNLTYVLSPKGRDLLLRTYNYRSFTDVAQSDVIVPLDKSGKTLTTSTGNITITLDSATSTIGVDFAVNFGSSIDLRNGAIFLLSETIPNLIIGTIDNGNYLVSIQDGYLFIAGQGNLSSLNEYVESSLPTQQISNSILNDLCYQYHYDKRNRLIEKKIPQKGWEYIIYDKLDRPVLTQDANLRLSNQWMFTKYDESDRTIFSGLFLKIPLLAPGVPEKQERLNVQQIIDMETVLSESSQTTSITIDGQSVYYTNDTYPYTNLTLHSIYYFDSYNSILTSAFADPISVFGQQTISDIKTFTAGNLIRVLGTNQWITSVTYYDDKGRVIYNGVDNEYLDTRDVIKSEFDFIGKTLKTESTHQKGTNPLITILDNFTYDHADRLLTHKQSTNGQTNELIVKNEYDELGQLSVKSVGGIEASPLQDIDYSYNIRGWLKQINDVNNLGNDLFSFGINYNSSDIGLSNDALFNGNISETLWKTVNDSGSLVRGYAYEYDALNRITSGNMAIDTGSGFAQEQGYHLNGLQYDKNGNIMSLQRTGETAVFDNLTYTYDGNQLIRVNDAITNQQTEGFIDGNLSGDDYIYDVNGNMTEDKNKGITAISYNHLNLPTDVEFNNSSTEKISYIYDATGLKLKKIVNDNGNITTTEYTGNYIYENSNLKFFSQPEGYVEPDGSTYNYTYQFKDHLGNIRLSYTKDHINSVIIQEDYTGTTYNWSDLTNGNVSLSSVNDKLNISLKNKWNSTSKYVTFTPGKPIHIEFDFENIDMVNPFLFVREQVNGVWEPLANRDVLALNANGHYELDLNPVGDYIRIYFEKGNASDDGVVTTISVDNLVITQNILEVLEENNYYPFGLKHKGYNNVISSIDHPYGFQEQEEQNELNLNWIQFKWRNHNPEIGRFMSIDPLTEKYNWLSTYQFASNQPIHAKEIEGLENSNDLTQKIFQAVLDTTEDMERKGLRTSGKPIFTMGAGLKKSRSLKIGSPGALGVESKAVAEANVEMSVNSSGDKIIAAQTFVGSKSNFDMAGTNISSDYAVFDANVVKNIDTDEVNYNINALTEKTQIIEESDFKMLIKASALYIEFNFTEMKNSVIDTANVIGSFISNLTSSQNPTVKLSDNQPKE